MQIPFKLLALLPLLLEATVRVAAQSSKCRTELGTKSIKSVPTAMLTTTKKPKTVTLASQKTVTTYKGFVSTKTNTITRTAIKTLKGVTDTFSSTTTLFAVSTITVPETITETETSTSTEQSISTTVVPTTTGFAMIQDTINDSDFNGIFDRRDIGHPHRTSLAKRAAKKPKGVLAMVYPNKVACTKTIENKATKTAYKTLKPATETYAFWSKTTTKTATQWTTSTKVPKGVKTTKVARTTSQVTTYTTTFETETEQTSTTTTEVLPGPTEYDACKGDGNYFGPNFISGGLGYFAVNVANNGPGVASDFKTVADGATTATECCNACQAFKFCETFIFRKQNKNCFLLYHDGNTCNDQSRHPNFILSRSGPDTGAGYVVGNGNCGYTYSGNSDGSVFPVGGIP